MSEWERKTGGGLAALVQATLEAGGPKAVDYRDHSRSYWCDTACFWYWKALSGSDNPTTPTDIDVTESPD